MFTQIIFPDWGTGSRSVGGSTLFLSLIETPGSKTSQKMHCCKRFACYRLPCVHSGSNEKVFQKKKKKDNSEKIMRMGESF